MEDSKNHKTIYDDDFEIIEEDNDFNYQKELTAKLDNFNSDFDQNMLNEIVSSSLLLLILKLKEDDNLPEGDTSYE